MYSMRLVKSGVPFHGGELLVPYYGMWHRTG